MTSGNNDDTQAEILSLGWIVGGSTPKNKSWDRAIGDLALRIQEASKGIDAPFKLNVVFHVPGGLLKPEFVGVRTGIFSKSKALLMVQVAIPEELPPDPAFQLKSYISAAIDEAARWAKKRKVPIDVSKLCEVLDSV